MALDFGKARVGVAVSDELGVLAHPRPALDGADRKALLADIVRLTKEESVARVLVGLPLEMAGGVGPSAQRVLSFAQAVANATGLEVELVDERLTTTEAQRKLTSAGKAKKDQRKHIDGAAASVLLQSWLDRRRRPLEG
jgi:putative Holliday junction resolvase